VKKATLRTIASAKVDAVAAVLPSVAMVRTELLEAIDEVSARVPLGLMRRLIRIDERLTLIEAGIRQQTAKKA
jgi:hypothetical protein